MIQQPGMVPHNAVGRESIFFFGTLMHARVLSMVLDRPIDADELQSATLFGYRRLRARDAVYPVLMADRAGTIVGLTLMPRSLRDLVRINHFEEDEYTASRVAIVQDGQARQAWIYIDVCAMLPSDQAWDLNDWASRDLDGFIERCRFWMSDSPL